MGDATRAIGGDPGGVFLAVESHSTKERKADTGKAKVREPSKRPWTEEIQRQLIGFLENAITSFPTPNFIET
jgi:hypothetical protein